MMRVYYEDLNTGRHYYVFGHHFLPGAAIEADENHSYQSWEIEQYLTKCGDTETDLDEVEEYARAFIKAANTRELTYDQWKATQLAQRLEKDCGVPIVEFRQNAQMLSPAMDELEAAIYSGRLHHDNCKVLAWMAGNVVLKYYKTDYKLPTKEKPHNKIDGMVALIMGVGLAMYEAPTQSTQPSVRELD